MKHQTEKIKKYKKLVKQYHKTLDLMSAKGLKDLDDKIADAFEYARAIDSLDYKNKNILDIGSGSGLPGIIIAITLPFWKINLVERRTRRASFLNIVSSQAQLKNVEVHLCDVKDLKLEPQTVISAQAVASFKDLYCLSSHLHAPSISLLSRKGATWHKELDDLKNSLDIEIAMQKPKELSSHGNLIAISLLGGRECL